MDISLVRSVMVRVVTSGLDFERRRETETTATKEVFDLASELADRGVHIEHAEHAIEQHIDVNKDRIIDELAPCLSLESIEEELETRAQIEELTRVFLTPDETIDTDKLTGAMDVFGTSSEKRLLFRLVELGIKYIQLDRRIEEIQRDSPPRQDVYSSDDLLMSLADDIQVIENDVKELCKSIDVKNLS